MHLEVVSESVVALAQETLTMPVRMWLRKLLNGMALADQYEHFDKAGLSVAVLAVKEAVDLCAWGNEHNTNSNTMYTVGFCQTPISRANKCRAAAAIAAAETSGALVPVLPKRQ